MGFFLELLASLVAVVTSLVAIVSAVRELGSASRLRRRATYWREQLTTPELQVEDRQVFLSLYREASAQVVALQAYPSRKLARSASLYVLLPLITLITTTYAAGTTYVTCAAELPYEAFVLSIVSPFVLLLGVQTTANTVVQRRVLASRYLNGLEVKAQGRHDEQGNAVYEGATQKWYQLLAMFGHCVGISLLLGTLSFVSAASQVGFDGTAPWVSLTIVIAMALSAVGLTTVLGVFKQQSRPWVHPRP